MPGLGDPGEEDGVAGRGAAGSPVPPATGEAGRDGMPPPRLGDAGAIGRTG
ncbi:MAG: hypothetical protein R6X03_12635 [Methyloceanibacter sp.]